MPELLMPRLSDTMEEGTIARWLKAPGDAIARGEVVAEVDTDKATMDLEAFDSGVLAEILVPAGGAATIGTPVAVIASGSVASGSSRPGRDRDAPVDARSVAGEKAAGAPATRGDAVGSGAGPVTGPRRDDRVAGASGSQPVGAPRSKGVTDASFPPSSSPLARAIARRAGIDLAGLAGSGPGGRVVRADVEKAIEAASRTVGDQAPPTRSGLDAAELYLEGKSLEEEIDEVVPLSNLQRVAAQRLSSSALVPQFSLRALVDAGALLALRAEVNGALPEGSERLTVTDLIVKACAVTLRAHPEVNASWADDGIVRHAKVNVGVAVAMHDGLVVPVIRDADKASVREIARRARDLAGRARDRRLLPDELRGGTFTLSNLGPFGIEEFTAVLNPPEAAILAVGTAGPQPVVRGGEVVVRTTMALTLSADHRVLDGASAARFLVDLRAALESPLLILV